VVVVAAELEEGGLMVELGVLIGGVKVGKELVIKIVEGSLY
jgi:hypothetical protein